MLSNLFNSSNLMVCSYVFPISAVTDVFLFVCLFCLKLMLRLVRRKKKRKKKKQKKKKGWKEIYQTSKVLYLAQCS